MRLVAWFTRLARAGFRCPSGATVADLTAGCPPAVTRALWEPLCIAALNTPPAQASAQCSRMYCARHSPARRARATSGGDHRPVGAFPEAAVRGVANAGVRWCGHAGAACRGVG